MSKSGAGGGLLQLNKRIPGRRVKLQGADGGGLEVLRDHSPEKQVCGL